jgi:hypothetical protein
VIKPENIHLLPQMQDEQFMKDILRLEADIHVLGWDQENALYAVMGEPGDYLLEKITNMSGHPVDWLRDAVCGTKAHPGGGRLHDSVRGVAVASEAWRHPLAQDFETRYPEDWAMFMKLADLSGVDKDDKERVYHHINNALERLHDNVMPHSNPRRVELRSVMVLMRDGLSLGVSRDRDRDPVVFQMGDLGRVLQAMKATLTGCWPNDPHMNEPTEHRE